MTRVGTVPGKWSVMLQGAGVPVTAIICALALFAMGGSSRSDAWILFILRPMLIVAAGAVMIWSASWGLREMRSLWLMLLLFAATMLIQLIPLPPELWLSLPGHDPYRAAADVAGVDQPWRVLSLTPDLTINSLFALIPAAIVVLLYGMADSSLRRRSLLLPVILGIGTALVGIAQIATGSDSPLYLHRPTSDHLPVGVFANRNHQAVFLAAALPALAAWLLSRRADRAFAWIKGSIQWVAAGFIALLFILVILVSGSRSGALAVGMSWICIAYWLLSSPAIKATRQRRITLGIALLMPLIVLVLALVAGRAYSLDRVVMYSGAAEDFRWVAGPTSWKMALDFFPTGAGFGAFDQVFRQYEPDALLKPTYFNRAHNDFLETIFSGGISAAAVLFIASLWWIARVRVISLAVPSDEQLMARAGAVIVAIYAVASAFDYPLRTPLAGATFALACCWMLSSTASRKVG